MKVEERIKELIGFNPNDEKECLEAVKNNGYALMYVKEQTPDICLKAIKENSLALMYVQNQTEDICLEAVRQNGNALIYVDK